MMRFNPNKSLALGLSAAALVVTGCDTQAAYEAGQATQALHEEKADRVAFQSQVEGALRTGEGLINCTNPQPLGAGAVETSLIKHFPELAEPTEPQREATALSANEINKDIAQPTDMVLACQLSVDGLAKVFVGDQPVYVAVKDSATS